MEKDEFKKNGDELATLLQGKIPNCEIDPFSILLSNGLQVTGTIREETFYITLKRDECMLVSAKKMELLEEMKTVLVEYMGQNPICQYRQTIEGNPLNTMEWDIENPEDRITKIVNGKLSYPAENLVLFGFNLDKFTNKEAMTNFAKKESERIKNARIYGIDPGCVSPDVEKVEKYPEWKLFLIIDALGYYLWSQRHEESHGRIEHVDTTEQQYGISYLVNQTKKYGVELPDPEVDKHLTSTESYHKWYKFWKNWMESFENTQWNLLNKKIGKGEDISAYLPKKKWNEWKLKNKKELDYHPAFFLS